MYAPDPAIEHRVREMPETMPRHPAEATKDIEVFNPDGQAPVLLLSDHSGRTIPDHLEGLGLPEEERSRHIAWDIGATDMTRQLAKRLDAPAVLNHISRLVIDPNRIPGTPMSDPTLLHPLSPRHCPADCEASPPCGHPGDHRHAQLYTVDAARMASVAGRGSLG